VGFEQRMSGNNGEISVKMVRNCVKTQVNPLWSWTSHPIPGITSQTRE